MEGRCLTGQSPQGAVVAMEEEKVRTEYFKDTSTSNTKTQNLKYFHNCLSRKGTQWGGNKPKRFQIPFKTGQNLSLVLSGVLNIGTAMQCSEITAAAIVEIREILRRGECDNVRLVESGVDISQVNKVAVT